MLGAIRNPKRSSRRRVHARGAIVRRDRGRLCAAITGECRGKRNCVSESCSRWGIIGEDPIGFADGPNLYQYAGNDPVNFRDPSGLSASHPLYGQGLGVLQPQFQQSALANLSGGGSNTFSSPSSTGSSTFGFGSFDTGSSSRNTLTDFSGVAALGDRGLIGGVDTSGISNPYLVAPQRSESIRNSTYLDTFTSNYSPNQRILSGSQAVAGVAEVISGGYAFPASLGTSSLLIGRGLDDVYAGASGVFTGRATQTGTSYLAESTARGLGASESTSQSIGSGIEFGSRLISPAGAVANIRNVTSRSSRAVDDTTDFLFADPRIFLDDDAFRALRSQVVRDGKLIKEPIIDFVEVNGQKFIVDGNGRTLVAETLKIQDQLRFQKVELPYKSFRTPDDVLNGSIDVPVHNRPRGGN